jgi:hypothetical protein
MVGTPAHQQPTLPTETATHDRSDHPCYSEGAAEAPANETDPSRQENGASRVTWP